jgi:hypothetical protein
MTSTSFAAGLGAILMLAGCSTPGAALDQARHGTGLISDLELSLTEFRRIEQNAEQARRDSLADQLRAIDEVKRSANQDMRARRSAGDTATLDTMGRLLGDADAMASDDVAAREARTANGAALAALMSPLPSTTAATTAAQKKLAVMGVELSREKRLDEFLSFASAIKASVKENEQKIADAEAAARK